LQIVFAAALAVGVLRLIRRLSNTYIRAISTPDDYFSLGLLTVWFFLGVLAAPNDLAHGELHLLAYFVMTAFFLIYVPFSKISHYLYYPFTRYWLGRSLGHRGVFPLERGRALTEEDREHRDVRSSAVQRSQDQGADDRRPLAQGAEAPRPTAG